MAEESQVIEGEVKEIHPKRKGKLPIWTQVVILAASILTIAALAIWPGWAFGHPVWGPWPKTEVEVAEVESTATPIVATTKPATPTQAPTEIPKPTTVLTENTGTNCDQIPGYDQPPQPQIGHPSFYIETGVNEKTRCWTGTIEQGFIGIVGGYEVDGVSGGVYRAVDQGGFTVKVTDGFLAIAVKETAQEEFCFRLSQAIKYGWAHTTEQPLEGWKSCELTTETIAQAEPKVPASESTESTTRERRATGENASLYFEPKETIYGWEIVLDSGEVCGGGECYLPIAPSGGVLTNGVINPWPDEVPEKTEVWDPNPNPN